ncbi:hypothetical protein AABB24_039959 [Solanum stoloniferum]|uniref:Uncharacterized protein n=1 Tax=Solanum stoloniferum TaxID=62892 RepID=A0ABD2QTX6_9SOLN
MEAETATVESGQCFERKKTVVVVTYNNRGGNEKKEDGEKSISGLLDGSGEYTLVYEVIGCLLGMSLGKKSSILLNKKAEAKDGDASLEISSSSKERVAIAIYVGVKASSTLSEIVNVSSPMPNQTVGSSSVSGTSKKLVADELIEDKSKASIQHGSNYQK